MKKSLNHQVIVITGASQGLGKVLALQAAELGAKVALVARSAEKLQLVQKEIQAAGCEAEIFICDIRDNLAVLKTVAEIVKKFQTIDVVINNAGVWTDNDLEQIHPEHRQLAFDTNALGNIQFTQAVLPQLQAQNAGHVVNIISTAGAPEALTEHHGLMQTYVATKWAMTGFAEALKVSLAQTKIKITNFFPGGFDSELYATAGYTQPHTQPWMMQAEDLAEIIVFALTRPSDVLIEKIVVTKSW